ncbi:hypothetical protein ACJJTC_000727 [Scirpophaga incertulas]
MRRITAACIYNLSCFCHGCSTGWVSGVFGQDALTGGSWLAALPCLVALPAAPIFAVLADARGRKVGSIFVSICFIACWTLAAWGGQRGIWASRVAAGVGGAGALTLAPIYCTEIAPETRGLAALPSFAISCGILFSFLAGGMMSARSLSLIMLIAPVVLLIANIWLPETPSYLISVGKMQDAAKIICWFDGSNFREDVTDVIEQQEVRIRTSECYTRRDTHRRDSDTFQPMLQRNNGVEANTAKKTQRDAYKELLCGKRGIRAISSFAMLAAASVSSGSGVVGSFAVAVLRYSARPLPHLNITVYNSYINDGTNARSIDEASVTAEVGAIVCAVALFIGGAVAVLTVDRIGRKILIFSSCSGIAFLLAVLGAYCDPSLRAMNWNPTGVKHVKTATDIRIEKLFENITLTLSRNETSMERFNMFKDDAGMDDGTLRAPIVLLSIVMFLYNIGLGSVPYVLISEMFSVNVRGLAASVAAAWWWLAHFVVLRYVGTVASAMGMHTIYYIGSALSVVAALYTLLLLPETKGKSREQIDEVLDGPLVVLKTTKDGQ